MAGEAMLGLVISV